MYIYTNVCKFPCENGNIHNCDHAWQIPKKKKGFLFYCTFSRMTRSCCSRFVEICPDLSCN